ncbi:MAG: matrixin, partial [Alphaproteobacteria bacterium]|nr:matrixin [Alphaproteobacteria bacterium]
DAATVDALVAYMDGRTDDMSRAEFMAAVAGLEVNQAHVNLVGLQATGIEYT